MNKVVLGFSGGVDSAVSAELLRQQGFQVLGLYLDNAGRAERRAALEAARQRDIELKVLDVHALLEERVCRPFAASYLRGESPNPCIICNPGVKFKSLLDYARETLGLSWVLLTCADGNTGSARVIEKNGGVLLDKLDDVIDGKPRVTRRYRIEL